MKKIVYVPLDDRPCNYYYPQLIAKICPDINFVTAPFHLMGKCKISADIDGIWNWLLEESKDADYAILSVDTLIYGNIIHSRTHHRTYDQINECLKRFYTLKSNNPDLIIEAYNLVARAAAYNDSFEDPDYWDTHGADIWKYGYLQDRINRGFSADDEKSEYEYLCNTIPQEYLTDFLSRREKDAFVNRSCVSLTVEGVFDHLVIPKDDTSEFGYAAIDQNKIVSFINEQNIMDRVMIYPGADEVGSVLLSRVFCMIHNYHPKIRVYYSTVLGPTIIPRYEDRPLGESVKAQIVSAGGSICDTAAESDLLFAVHSPGKIMEECCTQKHKDLSYSTHGCLPEFFAYIKNYVAETGKPVALADVAFSNGADLEMMRYAEKIGLFEKISAYGGWNTSENTNGMCLAHIIVDSYYNKFGFPALSQQYSAEFLIRKIIEDYLFQAGTMLEMIDEVPKAFDGLNPRYCGEKSNSVASFSAKRLRERVSETFKNGFKGFDIYMNDFYLPWDRVHELGFELLLK